MQSGLGVLWSCLVLGVSGAGFGSKRYCEHCWEGGMRFGQEE